MHAWIFGRLWDLLPLLDLLLFSTSEQEKSQTLKVLDSSRRKNWLTAAGKAPQLNEVMDLQQQTVRQFRMGSKGTRGV